MGVPKDAHNVALKQLEEDLSTECHVSDSRPSTDETAGSGIEREVVEGTGRSIADEVIRSAVVGAIQDIEGICFDAKRNAFGNLRVLEDAGVYVVEGISAEQVAARSGPRIARKLRGILVVRDPMDLTWGDRLTCAVIHQGWSGGDSAGSLGGVDADGSCRGLGIGHERTGEAIAAVESVSFLDVRVVRRRIGILRIYIRRLVCTKVEVGERLTAVIEPDRIHLPAIDQLADQCVSRSDRWYRIEEADAGNVWEGDATDSALGLIGIQRVLSEGNRVTATEG